ncbi:hypothetical protein COCNU_scaffold000920G000010 [Cocos nucifera]|nr:hypothetical protein [Cocos nucifera]
MEEEKKKKEEKKMEEEKKGRRRGRKGCKRRRRKRRIRRRESMKKEKWRRRSEIVFNNAEGGNITRSNLHDLLFAWMIIDDIIDAGQDFLHKKWRKQPDLYHKCIVALIMTVDMCIQSTATHYELASTIGEFIFGGVSDDDKKKFRPLFSIINIDNVHWHLVVMDMDAKKVIHLNSIKRNAKYKASAKKWHKILGAIFHIYCDNAEVGE